MFCMIQITSPFISKLIVFLSMWDKKNKPKTTTKILTSSPSSSTWSSMSCRITCLLYSLFFPCASTNHLLIFSIYFSCDNKIDDFSVRVCVCVYAKTEVLNFSHFFKCERQWYRIWTFENDRFLYIIRLVGTFSWVEEIENICYYIIKYSTCGCCGSFSQKCFKNTYLPY